MIDYKLIGSRIKAARVKAHITQEVLAEQADVTVVYMSKIENGKVHPTLEVLYAICEALHYDFGSLFSAASSEAPAYQQDKVNLLFSSLAPTIKPIALELLESLTKIEC